MRRLALAALLLLTIPLLAGCADDGDGDAPDSPVAGNVGDYVDLRAARFNTTGSYSEPLESGAYGFADPIRVDLPSFDGTIISLGIHRPLIPGCPADLSPTDKSECKTPVLMDAGPYFTRDSVLSLSTRPPTGIWFVPHGYTMVYMAVRGTGGSEGCMEFMSLNEQKDVDFVTTWLGQQSWSTGNVGIIGRSYDGTTPFFPAVFGNPYLKTIVPISGVIDQADLMFANGTSELRGPIMHSFVYWFSFGLAPEPTETAASQLCPEVVKGAALGPYASQTGDTAVLGLDDYWTVRGFGARTLANYNGSIFIVHGLQDWNVNPRMVVPFVNELQDAGIKTKAMLGQWGHAYPDRADEHPNVRWDWAEILLRWFDSELKGVDIDTGPAVEVEDHRHEWWQGDSYPDRDVKYADLQLNGDGTAGPAAGDGAAAPCPAASVPGVQSAASCTFVTDELAGPVRVSGLVRLNLSVTPITPTGATVYGQLYDVYPDGRTVWLGHGWINLLYYEGGHERQVLVPGQAVTAKMQFEPLEAYLPAGHRLQLVLSQDVPAADGVTGSNPTIDTLPRPEQGAFLINTDGPSVLRVPLLYEFHPSDYESYALDHGVAEPVVES